VGRNDGPDHWGGNKSPDIQYTSELFESTICDGVSLPEAKNVLEGHIQVFHFFGGGPWHITYDNNLKTVVYAVLKGKNQSEMVIY
jgi:hypothetical protein